MKNLRYPLVTLPSDVQTALYLIGEELKSRKLFYTLRKVGFDYSFFQPHLDTLILRSFNIDDGSDEVFDTYCKIVARRAKKISADRDSLMRQALKVYHELSDQRKLLKKERR